ncbi:MAG: DUF4339 domain-containing protein [Terrimicrobiaceae bacterium]
MYHYIDSNNQPQGPYSLDELRRLADRRVLTMSTLVATVGASSWSPLGTVLAAEKNLPPRPQSIPTEQSGDDDGEFGTIPTLAKINQWFDRFIARIYKWGTQDEHSANKRFRKLLTTLNQILQITILTCGAFLAVLCFIAGNKLDSPMLFLPAVAAVPAAFIFQFLVALFASANTKLLSGPPIRLYTFIIQKTITLIGTLLLVALAGIGIWWPVVQGFSRSAAEGFSVLGVGIGLLASLAFITWLSANSQTVLNVQPISGSEQNAADYFSNLVRFFGRFLLALTPLCGVVCSIILLLLLVILGTTLLSSHRSMELMMTIGTLGVPLLVLFLLAVLLPVIAHFCYVFIVTSAEIVSAFFRLVESSQKTADCAEKQSKPE